MDSISMSWFCAFCLAISFISCFHEVYGRTSFPVEQDNEFISLNDTHVKTIKTEYGDIYDCVELYKQPAFQHPMLRNHKIQMRPTNSKNVSQGSLRLGLKDECPTGTVPIRRTTKQEEFQAKAIFDKQFQQSKVFNGGQEDRIAGVFTNQRRFPFGLAEGYISTHNPEVGQGQLSASLMAVENGQPSTNFGTIRVGWMVYPDLYRGDRHTRLYASWGQFKNSISKGCFNTYCAGFVQVNKRIPIDAVITRISTRRAKAYFKLSLALLGGHWRLRIGEHNEEIGYWPRALFSGLNEGAQVVRWGGWVSTTNSRLPMMGSGMQGVRGSKFRRISTATVNGRDVYTLLVDQNPCYKAGFTPYRGPYWGASFWYGGNGGDVRQCPRY